jgi:hypothetical protein
MQLLMFKIVFLEYGSDCPVGFIPQQNRNRKPDEDKMGTISRDAGNSRFVDVAEIR